MPRAQLKRLIQAMCALAGVTVGSAYALTLPPGPARSAIGGGGTATREALRINRHSGRIVVRVIQTDGNLSQWMQRLPDIAMNPGRAPKLAIVTVNDAMRYQRIRGFGALLSDSSAWLIHSTLDHRARQTLMRDLFSPTGLALNYIRLPMGASGFSVRGKAYSYDDLPLGRSDPRLRHFSVAHDLRYIIPTLRQALAIDKRIFIIASPWSPPGWMKANQRSDNFHNAGTLLQRDYGPLATYFVKFIEDYRAHGITISAVTPQNEPNVAADPGLQLSERDEAAFITRYLHPALTSAHLTTALYGLDLSWDTLSFADALATGAAGRDLRGVAWHCYYGSPSVMSQFHATTPALVEVMNECSPEIRPFPTPELLIESLRNWASGVSLHNLALDPAGGPVEQPDYRCRGCKGLVTIDQATHRTRLSVRYYQLGQVSRFVSPGATRIGSNTFVAGRTDTHHFFFYATAGLDDVAFINSHGGHVLVTYNNSPRPIRFAVRWRGHIMIYHQPARAMTTFTWK